MPYCQNCGTKLVNAGQFCQNCGTAAGSTQGIPTYDPQEKKTIHLRKGGRIVVERDSVNLFTNKRKVKHNRPIVFPTIGLTKLGVRRKVNWGLVALGAVLLLLVVAAIASDVTTGAHYTTGAIGLLTGPSFIASGCRRRLMTLHFTDGQHQNYKSYNRPLLNNLVSTIKSAVPTAETEIK